MRQRARQGKCYPYTTQSDGGEGQTPANCVCLIMCMTLTYWKQVWCSGKTTRLTIMKSDQETFDLRNVNLSFLIYKVETKPTWKDTCGNLMLLYNVKFIYKLTLYYYFLWFIKVHFQWPQRWGLILGLFGKSIHMSASSFLVQENNMEWKV